MLISNLQDFSKKNSTFIHRIRSAGTVIHYYVHIYLNKTKETLTTILKKKGFFPRTYLEMRLISKLLTYCYIAFGILWNIGTTCYHFFHVNQFVIKIGISIPDDQQNVWFWLWFGFRLVNIVLHCGALHGLWRNKHKFIWPWMICYLLMTVGYVSYLIGEIFHPT